MTQAEVAAAAFPGSLDPEGAFIPESAIITAQQKFFKPVLGPLYDTLADHPELLEEYVKPALAQWVRYLVLPSIAAQVGATGIIAPRGQNFESVSPMAAAALRARTKADARALVRRMIEHIKQNPERYHEYCHEQNVMSRVSTTGNIIL